MGPAHRRQSVGPLLLAVLVFVSSCSRKNYREHADDQVYGVLAHETAETPWVIPEGFTISPATSSRLHDPSNPDFPTLPLAGPRLYSYGLPELERAVTSIRPTTSEAAAEKTADESALPIQPIPERYWQAIPVECLSRMFEFESVRSEFELEHDKQPPEEMRDASRRLSLVDIFENALLNSREYQSQKESLYRSALSLTLERFQFFPAFSNPGADASYTNTDSGGTNVESSSIGSSLGLDALLVTGGRILANFTNNIVFTFGGSEGFTKSINSEILVSLSQSIFQRDVRLNPLVQAERDLVYAARDFMRFRREFFFGIASQYYRLLQNYRSIEIESQNYFSLVRTFEQARAELAAGVRNAPNPVSVDQFEQGMLSGRSSLISRCNQLEQSLDGLKITLGIPTETPLNVDLAELDELTLRDQVEVAAERVTRWLQRVADRVERNDRAEIINADIFLAERVFEMIELNRLLDGRNPDTKKLQTLLNRLRVERETIEVDISSKDLETARSGGRAPPFLIAQHVDETANARVELASRQVEYLEIVVPDDASLPAWKTRAASLQDRLTAIRERIPEDPQELTDELLASILAESSTLNTDAQNACLEVDEKIKELEGTRPTTPEEQLAETMRWTNEIVQSAKDYLKEFGPGLPPVDIDRDAAMGTALTQRLDLMNERGRLADSRRNVKIRADDLRSVLDLNASSSISSENNKPFKFTGDELRTQVGIRFDAPLNRRAQRNSYRNALISYNASRRNLMALEDRIKLDVRNGLRSLDQARLQYPISVTRAALAAEQVISIQLQLALGVEGVRGRDLLDALQSSREALISVANNRIGYLVDRAQFVLDLEAMFLDEHGFWQQVADTQYQPEPNLEYPENAGPLYGDIPDYIMVSDEFRSIEEAGLPAPESEDETLSARQPGFDQLGATLELNSPDASDGAEELDGAADNQNP